MAAIPLTLKTQTIGQLSTQSEVDRYQVNAPAAGTLNIWITGQKQAGTYQVSVYDAQNALIDTEPVIGGAFQNRFGIRSAGIYYVDISTEYARNWNGLAWLCCINRQPIDFAINYFAYDLSLGY